MVLYCHYKFPDVMYWYCYYIFGNEMSNVMQYFLKVMFKALDIPSHLFVLTSLNTAVVLVQCVRAETEKQSGDPIPSLLLCLLSDGGCNREIKEASLSGK